MARASQYRLLWRAAMAQSSGSSRHVVGWTTVVSTLLITVLGWIGTDGATGIGLGICTLAVILLMLWATQFVPGAAEMGSPANAQLTPSLVTRLRELTALVWALGMVALTLGVVLLLDRPGLMLLWAILLSLSMALGTAGVASAGYLTLPIWMGFLLKDWLPGWLLAGLAHPVAPLMVLAALGPLGMAAARAMLPRAGERHWEMVAARQRWDAHKNGHPGSLEALPGWLRCVPLPRGGRRDPGAQLLRALGPDVRAWGLHVVTIGCVTLALLAVLTRSGILPAIPPDMFNPAVTTSILLLFLFQVGTTVTVLARSAGEQALVRLAPAIPGQRERFNMLLARALLGQAFGLWAIVSAGALFLAWLTGGVAALPKQAAMCCMMLPALVLVLRDHARAPHHHMFVLWMAAVALSLAGPVAGALLAWTIGLPYGPTATAAALVLAGVLVRRGLRSAGAAPFALPAGRLD